MESGRITWVSSRELLREFQGPSRPRQKVSEWLRPERKYITWARESATNLRLGHQPPTVFKIFSMNRSWVLVLLTSSRYYMNNWSRLRKKAALPLLGIPSPSEYLVRYFSGSPPSHSESTTPAGPSTPEQKTKNPLSRSLPLTLL